MATDAAGFARPRQFCPVTEAAEARIAGSCPGSVIAPWSKEERHQHPLWGPWRQTLTGAASDPEVRFHGASGGALSALLIHALEQGTVDRVLHIEPDPKHPTGNRVRWSSTREEVLAGAGSRYASSSPLAAIEEALAQGGRFAFVGKPCDVSALRQLGRYDTRVAKHVPLVLSFFCGGLPSSAGAADILRAMGLEQGDVVEFRYRGQGWPGLTVARTADGRSGEMSYAESWGRHLSRQVQFRCKICPDAVGGVADIACADAWYGDAAGYPSFEEKDGRSLIMSRTAAGEAFLHSAQAAAAIETAPLPIEEIERMQPAQAQRKRMIAARTAAVRASLQPVPIMRDLEVGAAARQGDPYDITHNFLGTMRRVLLRRWRKWRITAGGRGQPA
ncbi:Coenzyme F420 hydrogenase/dehydrogenase, beta subunit C-terminal domain [Sphingomonas sp. IC-11]|uniref:Coenzyme F420 hydrogenase/dehydrogenase, beta subunit C-terminal domain n=1 Tax=Sphingomonas sp. IC-11 TaxID=2898528 RepID=UPI001E304DA2|nr:Coenzyme F420 hydrogenase/dehydrogenase, beta subunit C-terminal domain [Sphingomonas sp. IC-11]MCD2315100.1 Coenzyme F420 hydrogenase/dehydrogenase, beta subunit C-terminal domain [Sphingomonas sp. IC-11]